MARIPVATDLGRTSARSGRGIARQNTTSAGLGVVSIGRSLEQAGSDIQAAAETMRQRQTTLDVAKAELAKNEGFLNLTNSFDQDTEYGTYDERARAGVQQTVDQAAALIRDPEARELWKVRALSDAAVTADSIRDRGVELQVQADKTAFDEVLEANRRLYVAPETPEEVRERVRADIEGSIAVAEANGLLTPAEAAKRRQTYLEDADYSRGLLAVDIDPSVVPGRALPIRASDGVDLSSVDTAVLDTFGGLQSAFGRQLPIISGFRDPEYNASVGGASNSQHTHGKAIDIDVSSLPEAERLRLIETASALGFTGIGVYDNSIHLDLGSKRAWGPDYHRGSVPEWAEPTIGRHLSGDIKSTAPAPTPDWYTRLSPEQQATVQKQAEQVRNARDAETRARIEMAAQDAPAAIASTGAYTGYTPTQEDFLAAYGPIEAPRAHAEYQSSVATSREAYSFRTMSNAEIAEAVQEARPTATGQGAAAESERYETLTKAAEQVITAREEDPVGYLQQMFPNVREAWEGAQDPDSVRQAIELTQSAQQQLGMPPGPVLPGKVAQNVAAQFTNAELPQTDRVEALTSTVFATDDPVQRRAIFQQLVEEGVPATTEAAIAALERGDDGAARRLFQAAMIDPADLPGKIPETPARISEEIQAKLMSPGAMGDIYYGLSGGQVENFDRAITDAKLMQNAVSLRLLSGESLGQAVDSVAKDIFGDVRVVNGDWNVGVRVLLPTEQDPAPYLRGFGVLKERARDALSLPVPDEVPVADGSRAVIEANTATYIESVMAEGYFTNAGDGYVFMDPFVGAPIAGEDGAPLTFTDADVLAAAGARASMGGVPTQDEAMDWMRQSGAWPGFGGGQ